MSICLNFSLAKMLINISKYQHKYSCKNPAVLPKEMFFMITLLVI